MTNGKGTVFHGFTAHENVQIVIKNDTRAIKGFGLSDRVMFAAKTDPKMTDAELEAAIIAFCDAVKITGIPVVKTADLPWTKPWSKPRAAASEKHRQKLFKWDLMGKQMLRLMWEAIMSRQS